MGQELGLDRQAGVFSLPDRFAEMGGIPVNDDGCEQVEPSHAVVLALARAVADFALAPDAERVFERVMTSPLFRPVLALRCISASSSQSTMKSVGRIGRELSQQLARRKGTAGQGCGNPPPRYPFIPAGAALSVRGTVYRTLNRRHSP